MNLPPGIIVKTGIDTATIDFAALLRELKDKVFNGYLAITVEGASAIEEGIVVFDNGKVVASFYEYFKYNKQVLGDLAFQRVMNAAASKHGVADIFQLTNDQVQLILAFNEQAICLPSEGDIKKLRSESFSPLFEEQIKDGEGTGTKTELLKKFKLGDVEKKEKVEQVQDETEDFLRDLFKGKQ
ncbi:MAG TPA: DUF2226 domain-containing protein [Candidatus Norongarragalinales archaeon]|nr:DUF2226 domain-containing protein [Candidatus Norongarragalinales archaeon]